MTAICDDSGVISLAAIMGGAATSCDDTTTDVFIESAYFAAARTARTGRALQIPSDARYRFERGVDPAFTQPGMELATRLVLELCGTPQTVVAELEIAGRAPDTNRIIDLPVAKTRRHTGVDVTYEDQEKILTALGFKVVIAGDILKVTPPSWRPDIDGVADLVEEIVRVKGYDLIPATSLDRTSVVTRTALDAADIRANAVRRALAGQGLLEAVTWSFMPSHIAAQFGGVADTMRLLNPISSDLDVMRPTILGNLITAAGRNATRGFGDVALFEVGAVYKDATPEGQTTLAAIVRAGNSPRHWLNPTRPVDAFDAKADALAALAACGAPSSLQITTDAPAWYHPGRSGVLRLGPTVLAYFGEVHPAVLQACDVKGPIVAAEIFFASLPHSRAGGAARPLLKLESLQAVTRDFAFVMGRDVTAAKLIKAVRDADKNLIREVSVFDVYEGERIGADQKSIALSVSLQPVDKSLTDAEIDAVAAKITASVAKSTGATLRN
jgi:phenylalanyl-tRNA synthetase beta chain